MADAEKHQILRWSTTTARMALLTTLLPFHGAVHLGPENEAVYYPQRYEGMFGRVEGEKLWFAALVHCILSIVCTCVSFPFWSPEPYPWTVGMKVYRFVQWILLVLSALVAGGTADPYAITFLAMEFFVLLTSFTAKVGTLDEKLSEMEIEMETEKEKEKEKEKEESKAKEIKKEKEKEKEIDLGKPDAKGMVCNVSHAQELIKKQGKYLAEGMLMKAFESKTTSWSQQIIPLLTKVLDQTLSVKCIALESCSVSAKDDVVNTDFRASSCNLDVDAEFKFCGELSVQEKTEKSGNWLSRQRTAAAVKLETVSVKGRVRLNFTWDSDQRHPSAATAELLLDAPLKLALHPSNSTESSAFTLLHDRMFEGIMSTVQKMKSVPVSLILPKSSSFLPSDSETYMDEAVSASTMTLRLQVSLGEGGDILNWGGSTANNSTWYCSSRVTPVDGGKDGGSWQKSQVVDACGENSKVGVALLLSSLLDTVDLSFFQLTSTGRNVVGNWTGVAADLLPAPEGQGPDVVVPLTGVRNLQLSIFSTVVALENSAVKNQALNRRKSLPNVDLVGVAAGKVIEVSLGSEHIASEGSEYLMEACVGSEIIKVPLEASTASRAFNEDLTLLCKKNDEGFVSFLHSNDSGDAVSTIKIQGCKGIIPEGILRFAPNVTAFVGKVRVELKHQETAVGFLILSLSFKRAVSPDNAKSSLGPSVVVEEINTPTPIYNADSRKHWTHGLPEPSVEGSVSDINETSICSLNESQLASVLSSTSSLPNTAGPNSPVNIKGNPPTLNTPEDGTTPAVPQAKSAVTMVGQHDLFTGDDENKADRMPNGKIKVEALRAYRCPHDGHTVYVFRCETANDSWDIRRRYNDFSQLHQRLGKFLEGEPNVILPPKRVWGNQSERVISQRRVQLQEYLVRVLEIFDPLNTSEHKQTNDSSPYNTLTAFLQLPAPPAI